MDRVYVDTNNDFQNMNNMYTPENMNNQMFYCGNSGLNSYDNSSYTYGMDIDCIKLGQLGFRQEEIECLKYVVSNGGKASVQFLTSLGMGYEQAKRIKYMSDICIGKISVETPDDLSKHLKKLFGNIRRISIDDLNISKIKSVPRKAVVAGIKDNTFKIYNSMIDKTVYDVVNVTPINIVVNTNKKPVLKYKQPKIIDGVVEIKEVKDDGNVIVSFNREYCRLLNRYVILCSLRKPEFHMGMVQIICIEGTKLYVYAKDIGTKENLKYVMNAERVYDYGVYAKDIKKKINAVAKEVYKRLCGVYAIEILGNQEFTQIEEPKEMLDTNNKDDELEVVDCEIKF